MPEKRPRRRREKPKEIIQTARMAVRLHYEAVQTMWTLSLQAKNPDWAELADLDRRLKYLERRAPWLREAE